MSDTGSVTQPREWLDVVPKIVSLLVSFSFTLGAADLFGKTSALGQYSTEFLSASDLVTATVRYAPIAICILVMMQFAEFVFPRPRRPGPMPFPRVAQWVFAVSFIGFWLVFWTFAPSPRSASLMLTAGFISAVALLRMTNYQSEVGAVPAWTPLVGFVLFFVVLGFLHSYQRTIPYVVAKQDQIPPTRYSLVCDQDDCGQGILVARFAETSVVRWSDSPNITYIPNSRLTRVSVADPVPTKAIFDVWGWLSDSLSAAPEPKQEKKPDAGAAPETPS